MKKIFKIFGFVFIILLSILFISYITLCIYVKSKEVKFDSKILLEEAKISLSDEQIKIAGFIYNDDKNPKFKKYPLIKDTFSRRNNIARYVCDWFIDFHQGTTMDHRIEKLATSRRLIRKIDYKILYNYYFSKLYFGNGVYGLNNASIFYFNKEYTDLTEEEYIKIIVSTLNPSYYNIIENRNAFIEKVKEIQNKLK